jgi:hypothetical protein
MRQSVLLKEAARTKTAQRRWVMNKWVRNIGGITLRGEEKETYLFGKRLSHCKFFFTKFCSALGSSPGLPDEYKGCISTGRSTEVLLWKSNESGSYQSFHLFICFSGQSVILCKLLCCTASNCSISAKYANCEEKFSFTLSHAFEHSHPLIKCSLVSVI